MHAELQKTNPIQIVVIEDCDDDAEITLRALRRANVSNPIIRLRDGQEAIDFFMRDYALARRHWPRRLLILDLKMPSMGGIDVVKTLRASPTTAMLPIVILTGSSEATARQEIAALGIDMFIPKPLPLTAVPHMIKYAESYWKVVAATNHITA